MRPASSALALSALVLAAFAVIELKVRHPLIRFGILRQGWVARANISAIALFGSYVSFQFILTIYLQSVLGWSPLNMALSLLPAGLFVVGLALAGLGGLAAGSPAAAQVCAAGSLAGIAALAGQRWHSSGAARGRLAQLLVTSALIPFLTVYWRLRGAWHYRVWFV